MNLYFNKDLAKDYQNNSQIIRILTEDWLANNVYCPCCGQFPVSQFDNNNPVGDFFCTSCQEQYELKSKNGKSLGNSIADGAYRTMLERITSDTNPSFFFLSYDKKEYKVNNLIIVPKHFFTADIIIPRQKGIPNRPNYIMCSINTSALPSNGKISIIEHGQVINQDKVIEQWKKNFYLREMKSDSKGWLLTTMNCLDRIADDEFSLKQMYAFEHELALKYPNNAHIKDKIRQQLQFLRDKGMIEFLGRGRYRKVRQ
ncbi:DpnI domain-containing protein [Moraxella pluranimalium]|uniref:Restriction endonuclease n=1 Tax=Moraxella pluranimalium TaxID=470453 RepID=A0A1T0CT42_9GAMM|nr:DpnI domain-containing protein [Moraxella pluranimalium]OOS25497.1 restriction endonuclease [Moraxella pluranimalium]